MSEPFRVPTGIFEQMWQSAEKECAELHAEIEQLRKLKTPASRELLNITQGCLDSAEAENERLLAALQDAARRYEAEGDADYMMMPIRKALEGK